MIEACIKKVDLERRTVMIATEDNRKITLTFPEGINIEVREPTTMGTMGGNLEDLREGYLVEVELGAQDGNGNCACASLICVS